MTLFEAMTGKQPDSVDPPSGDIPSPDPAPSSDDSDSKGPDGLKWHLKTRKAAVYLEFYPEQCTDQKATERDTLLNAIENAVHKLPAEWNIHGAVHDRSTKLKKKAKTAADIEDDKTHAHLLIWTYPINNTNYYRFYMGQLLGLLASAGIAYRLDLDKELLNHAKFPNIRKSEHIRFLVYNYHESLDAVESGKEHYTEDDIRTNLTPEEIADLKRIYFLKLNGPTGKKDIPAPSRLLKVEHLQRFRQIGEEGGNFEEFWSSLPADFWLSNDFKKACNEAYRAGLMQFIQSVESLQNNRLPLFVVGNPGVGKTTNCILACQDLVSSGLSLESNGSGMFDPLRSSHEYLILNDTHISYNKLLAMADNRYTVPDQRYSIKGAWCGSIFIITSNFPFVNYYRQHYSGKCEFSALKDRFCIAEVDDNGVMTISHVNERGDDKQKRWRVDMLTKFVKAFNKHSAQFHSSNSVSASDLFKTANPDLYKPAAPDHVVLPNGITYEIKPSPDPHADKFTVSDEHKY